MKKISAMIYRCLGFCITGSVLLASMAMAQGTAEYELTFTATWSSNTHPTDFPPGPHFSWMIGGTHNSNVEFWSAGKTASDGIKSMAETGGTSTLRSEINAAGADSDAIIQGSVFSSPGTDRVTFQIQPSHPLVTVTSMIAPSPDWFVGVSGLNLLDGSRWRDRVEVELFAYDAGTDGGTSYTSADVPLNPRVNIRSIAESPFLVNGSVKSVGTFVFQRQNTMGIEITPSTVGVPEGGSETFEVKLAGAPTGNVTVTIPAFTNTDITRDMSTLTFTTSGANIWSTPQTVTVTAAQDNDTQDDPETITLSASGGGYDGITETVTIRVADDDIAGAMIVVSSETVEVDEGASTSFEVSLSQMPAGNVTVNTSVIPSNPDLGWTPETLQFTTENWNRTQTIIVSAGNDNNSNNESATLTLAAIDGGYDLSPVKNISIEIIDVNNVPGAEITTDQNNLEIPEGENRTVNVKLAAAPRGTVTVIIPDFQKEAFDRTPESLNFTTENWNTNQQLTVTANNDTNSDDETETITLTASGDGYRGVTKSFTVRSLDDDVSGAGITVNRSSVSVVEGSLTTFSVALSARPDANVIVTISAFTNTDLTRNPGSLTFTTENWNILQPVTITADDDTDTVNESETITLTANGGGYNGETTDVMITVIDNDNVGIVVSRKTVTVEEGFSARFDVALSSVPSANVMITIPAFTNTDLTRSPEKLTFTPGAWNNPQGVTVSAAQDNNTTDEREIITLTASGGGYDGETVDITIEVSDRGNGDNGGGGGDGTPVTFAVTTVSDQIYPQGLAIAPLTLPIASGGTGEIKYTLTPALPGGLRFNDETRTISGNPAAATDQTMYTYKATDTAGESKTIEFTITVTAPLVFVAMVNDQIYRQAQAITDLLLPEASGGIGTITYTITPELPAGLNFDAATRTISGTPSAVIPPTTFVYRATDPHGTMGTLQFSITVTAPLAFTSMVDDQVYPQGQVITDLILPEASGGAIPHTYSLMPALPAGLIFNSETRTISGTPTEVIETAAFVYTATDARNEKDSLAFTIRVYALSFAETVTDQSYPRAQPIVNLVLPEVSDGVPPIEYTFTLFSLPLGLRYDSNMRTLSGTPTEVTPEPVSLTYYAKDANGARDSLKFTIEVFSPVDAENEEGLPQEFIVHSNYPNPFQNSTNLIFDLPWPAQVQVEVMDVIGRRVYFLPLVEQSAGWSQEIELNDLTLPSGPYLYRMTAISHEGRFVHVGQLVSIR